MSLLKKDTFVCFDCETTGLDPENDRIIEIAAICFTFEKTLNTFETLIDPNCPIPLSSQEIHNISQNMVQGKPKIAEILPSFLSFIGRNILMGHSIHFDISLIKNEAKRANIPCPLTNTYIDTLRLARLYGDSPQNSLEKLRQHFNVEEQGAHRAMNDVIVNIEVFKHLSKKFQTTENLLKRLEKPILLKNMPLGKHKGRKFNEIPAEYLQWAANRDFDDDLLFSIRSELKNRKKRKHFSQSINPFASFDF